MRPTCMCGDLELVGFPRRPYAVPRTCGSFPHTYQPSTGLDDVKLPSPRAGAGWGTFSDGASPGATSDQSGRNPRLRDNHRNTGFARMQQPCKLKGNAMQLLPRLFWSWLDRGCHPDRAPFNPMTKPGANPASAGNRGKVLGTQRRSHGRFGHENPPVGMAISTSVFLRSSGQAPRGFGQIFD